MARRGDDPEARLHDAPEVGGRVGEIADGHELRGSLRHPYGRRRKRREFTRAADDRGDAEVGRRPQDRAQVVRVLHAVEIDQRPRRLRRGHMGQEIVEAPPLHRRGQDRHTLVVDRLGEPLDVLVGHHLEALPLAGTPLEQPGKPFSGGISHVHADDVPRPPCEHRLAGPHPVEYLLRLPPVPTGVGAGGRGADRRLGPPARRALRRPRWSGIGLPRTRWRTRGSLHGPESTLLCHPVDSRPVFGSTMLLAHA